MYNNLKNIKILLAEDEKRLATFMQSAIGDFCESFSVVYNGEEGLKAYKEIKPDIVITDIMMPKMNGLDMSRAIRKINPNQIIVILSAYSETDKLLTAIDLEIKKYFIKPFDPDELLDYLCEVIGKLEIKKIISSTENYIFNTKTKKLYRGDEVIQLTKREIDFIELLINQSDNFIDDETIKRELWNEKNVSDDRVRTFIRRLRQKTSKELIKNVSGQGYTLS
ncbi:Putative two-component response regulator [hydrothermal vent metagenome]|uniref:Putative two-component response regulator n=1 Tax=hydrothermal vent metagenome TaxID=652676 RepID=A0A1W1CFW5_9ZZZZ